jgi:hypothetical protein
MHYISNDWNLCKPTNICLVTANTKKKTEEILIDFKELIGKHSGENMAEAVWEMLTKYGLKGKVSLNSGTLQNQHSEATSYLVLRLSSGLCPQGALL